MSIQHESQTPPESRPNNGNTGGDVTANTPQTKKPFEDTPLQEAVTDNKLGTLKGIFESLVLLPTEERQNLVSMYRSASRDITNELARLPDDVKQAWEQEHSVNFADIMQSLSNPAEVAPRRISRRTILLGTGGVFLAAFGGAIGNKIVSDNKQAAADQAAEDAQQRQNEETAQREFEARQAEVKREREALVVQYAQEDIINPTFWESGRTEPNTDEIDLVAAAATVRKLEENKRMFAETGNPDALLATYGQPNSNGKYGGAQRDVDFSRSERAEAETSQQFDPTYPVSKVTNVIIEQVIPGMRPTDPITVIATVERELYTSILNAGDTYQPINATDTFAYDLLVGEIVKGWSDGGERRMTIVQSQSTKQ